MLLRKVAMHYKSAQGEKKHKNWSSSFFLLGFFLTYLFCTQLTKESKDVSLSKT